MNFHLKRYVLSSVNTFVSAFAVTFLALIQVQGFTFTKDTLISAGASALLVAVRALIKLFGEFFAGMSADMPADQA